MLKKLRIGPKLLLAPGLVLVLLIVTAAAGYYGMVRQNASMQNLVQVRAERLKAAADVSGDARYAHAHIYQLLAWVNGSFAQSRLDALGTQIKARHAGVEAGLRRMAAESGVNEAERKIVEQSLQSLAAYRKAVLETMEMAQMDQSIATNSMAKAETQFLQLNDQLAKMSALQKQLSEQAHARATGDFATLTTTMAIVVLLSIALSLGATSAASPTSSWRWRRAASGWAGATTAAMKSPTPRACSIKP
jgi:methyl-accepting chemotaxis protein